MQWDGHLPQPTENAHNIEISQRFLGFLNTSCYSRNFDSRYGCFLYLPTIFPRHSGCGFTNGELAIWIQAMPVIPSDSPQYFAVIIECR